jgi:nitric oxide dioxygenase
MLSQAHRDIVTATVPALRAHGGDITRVFYRDMLAAHPELFDYFNPANQREGGQSASLAASVLAYATHIANPAPLSAMVERIASKHVSLQIRAEHYPIVGKYLLGAIAAVLGDAATPAIIEAWGAAYGQLADIMIGREAAMAEAGAVQAHGWRGFKPFHVTSRVEESEVTTSYILAPVDEAPLPDFQPGQYLSIRLRAPGFNHQQIRQYSLSRIPNGRDYRISVKREPAPTPELAPGLISNHLHAALQPGDLIEVHAPLGDFVLKPGNAPVVLLSGGSGITAVLCMLQHLARNTEREVLFVHAARGRAHHAFAEEIRSLAKLRPGIKIHVLYDEATNSDEPGTHHDSVGRLSAEMLSPLLPAGADFYYCGPTGFIDATESALDSLQIPKARRFSEAFAPDPNFANLIAA